MNIGAIIGFISAVILIYLGMQAYLVWWVTRHFAALSEHRNFLFLLALLAALSFPATVHSLRDQPGLWAKCLAQISYYWLGISFIWLFCAVLSDLLSYGARLTGFPLPVGLSGPIVIIVVLGLGLQAAWNASRLPQIREMEVRLPNLSQSLDGLRLALVSDVHLGPLYPTEKFERIVGQVNALSPDLVVLNGDILDPGLPQKDRIIQMAKGFKSRYGLWAVLGNHEIYHGIDSSIAFYKDCSAQLLRNEIQQLPQGLQLAGFDDLLAAHVPPKTVEQVLSRIDPKRASIVLSHQPLIAKTASAFKTGLVLCGHTHNGQIFPFKWIVRAMYRCVFGLYHLDATQVYVTSGAGEWGPPMRLFTRSEIVLFTLRAD